MNGKKNKKVLVNMLIKVLNLVPINYTYGEGDEIRHGFDIKDFKAVFPELIHKDPHLGETIKADGLLPILIRCIQELNDDIEFLEARLSVLEREKPLIE
jgi:hypothetical protein